MAFKSIIGAACTCLAVVSYSADAALVSRLGGMAYYDTEANLTWLADANYSFTSGYDTNDQILDGLMNWEQSMAWVQSLNILGVTGWRLPETSIYDPNCNGHTFSGFGFSANCIESEMGNLFHNVLGGVEGQYLSNFHNDNYNLFSNIMPGAYWSATEHPQLSNYAMYQTFSLSNQSAYFKVSRYYGWAVKTGDVSVVPIPSAVWVFVSGLIGLVGIARRKAS